MQFFYYTYYSESTTRERITVSRSPLLSCPILCGGWHSLFHTANGRHRGCPSIRAKAFSRHNPPLQCLSSTARASELVEDRSSETLAANHLSVESFHQLSIQPPAGAMILLCESQLAPGRERPINPTFYLPWRTTRGIRLSVEVKFH